jgi:hypothetical protein
VVSVVFYDAREDPLNQSVRVYSAISRTGGESFEANQPVADVPSNQSVANPYRYAGNYLEYIGVATWDCAAYVAWTDARNQWPVYLGGFSYYYFDRVPFETEPPTIACPADLTVECDGDGGLSLTDPRALAFLNGCVASDNCDPHVRVSWTTNPGPITKFWPGTWLVQFTATDNAGNSSTCSARLTVVDPGPPQLNVTLTPDVLWPPNHRMVDIHADVTVSDECAGPAQLSWVLWSVTSNEPPDGTGDGNTEPDIEGVRRFSQDRDFRLRAERSGQGAGRAYQIVYYAEDGTYDVYDTTYVRVPHDRGGSEPIEALGPGGDASPVTTALHDARPNPFNPGTVVAFDLARAERVRIVIADVRGRRVRLLVDEVRPAGTHRAPWDGRNDGGEGVASGVYFVQMRAGRYSSVRKLVLLK